MDQSTRRVEEAPAKRLRSGLPPEPGETQELEPADEIGGHEDRGHPVAVGFDVGEGERQQSRVLEPGDVLLDMGVGSHDAVELDRVAVLVGVEPPVAVLEAREQAVLDAGVQRLAPNDQPGALWPAR